MPSPAHSRCRGYGRWPFIARALMICACFGLAPNPATAFTLPPYLLQWGSTGSATGQFSNCIDLAIATNGNVYVADRGNDRIQVFDPGGAFVMQWGGPGNGPGQFSGLSSISIGPNGDVYTVESVNNRVQVFTASGQFLRTWGSFGHLSGQFDTPQGICVSAAGEVYVGDTNNQVIQVFSSTGTYRRGWFSTVGFSYPKKVAVSTAGVVYVADAEHDAIQRFTVNGTYLGKWGTYGTGPGQLRRPDYIAVDASGNVYASELGGARVSVFDSVGTYLGAWGSAGSGAGQMTGPAGLAVDAASHVWLCDSGNDRIQQFGSLVYRADAAFAAVRAPNLAWGDYDADGRLDLLVMGIDSTNTGVTELYRNLGGGAFALAPVTLPQVGVGSALWADFDGDGRLDLLLMGTIGIYGSGTPSAVVEHNNGDGTFTAIPAGLPAMVASDVACADFDNDGRLDLAIIGPSDAGAIGRSYLNNGDGTFRLASNLPVTPASGAIVTGNLNQDGFPDLLVANDTVNNPSTRVLANQGAGTFAAESSMPVYYGPALALGDVDSDGWLDFLITGIQQSNITSALYRNTQGGSFQKESTVLPSTITGGMALADYDADGRLDLLLTGLRTDSSVVQVVRNQGSEVFADAGAGLPGLTHSAVAWADVLGDGSLGFVTAGQRSNGALATDLRLMHGQRVNAPPAAPVGLRFELWYPYLYFRWSAPVDDHTDPVTLTYDIRVGTTSGGSDLAAAPADPQTGRRRVARMGACVDTYGVFRFDALHNDVHWSVQAIDGGLLGGAFSADQVTTLAPTITSLVDVPGDAGGWMRLAFTRSALDTVGSMVPVASYGVWRLVPAAASSGAARATLAAAEAAPILASGFARRDGAGRFVVTGRSADVSGRRTAPSDAFPPGTWELVATVPALQRASYVVAVPTTSDATPNRFLVTTSSTSPEFWFAGLPATGESVNDKAPPIPTGFVATYSSNTAHLSWNAVAAPNFAYYALYRDTVASFTPGPSNFVASTTGTSRDDSGVPPGRYYKLAACDGSGNARGWVTAQAGTPVSVETAAPVRLGIEGARPNPVVGRGVRVSFALPDAAPATLALLDVAGRVVVSREVGTLGRGRFVLDLAAAHALAPGLYFARLTQRGEVRTARITVLE